MPEAQVSLCSVAVSSGEGDGRRYRKVPPSAFQRGLAGTLSLRQPGGIGSGLAAPVHPELGEHVRDVVLNGLLRQVEPRRYLPVRQTLGDEVEHAPFLVRELVDALVALGSVSEPIEHALGHRRVDQGLAVAHPSDGVHQVVAADLFQHVAGGPRHDGGQEGFVVGERGQHEALQARQAGLQLATYLDAVAVGEPDVENGDIGTESHATRDRLLGRRGLADDLDVVLDLEQSPQPAAHDLVVVYQEHSQRHLDLRQPLLTLPAEPSPWRRHGWCEDFRVGYALA